MPSDACCKVRSGGVFLLDGRWITGDSFLNNRLDRDFIRIGLTNKKCYYIMQKAVKNKWILRHFICGNRII